MTSDLLRHFSNSADVVLAQPIAGESIGSLQGEPSILEGATPRRTNPRFKGGLAEVALKSVLHLVPELTARQHHISPSANAESTRLMPSVPSLMRPVSTRFRAWQLPFHATWHDPCPGSGSD